jgi:hypothetical protein
MPAELKPDDEVTDWQYQWQGPDGAETWWPAMPFVHAQIYLVTLFPAFVLGVLLAWGFGTGLVSRVLPVIACLALAGFLVSEWIKHVDSARPIAWHRAVVRSELRAPRPPRPRSTAVVATSVGHLFDELATEADAGKDEPSDERADEPLDDEGRDEPPDESRDEPGVRPQAGPADRAAAARDDDAGPEDETWSELSA